MTREELLAECDRVEAMRREYGGDVADAGLVLVVPLKSPPRGLRVRVMPGVMGEFLQWNDETGCAVVRVLTSKLRRALG